MDGLLLREQPSGRQRNGDECGDDVVSFHGSGLLLDSETQATPNFDLAELQPP